jgi:hypothetical protein
MSELEAKEVAVMWIMHTQKGTFDFGYKAGEDPDPPKTQPVWMKDFKKKWDNPSDPVTFEFTLADEMYIQDALNYLYNGPANGINYPATEGDAV